MARELKVEAGHSMRLVRDEVSDLPKRGSRNKARAPKQKGPKRKRANAGWLRGLQRCESEFVAGRVHG